MERREWSCLCGESWEATVPPRVMKIIEKEWCDLHESDQCSSEQEEEHLLTWADDGGSVFN